jgi:hypothetical protein
VSHTKAALGVESPHEKLPILLVLIAFALLASPSSASAYGGGPGFPPGFFDNLHPKVKLVCKQVTKTLPNGHEIKLPKCTVEKVTPSKDEIDAARKDFKERIKELISRIKNGNK